MTSLLMDVALPVFDGLEATRRIRALAGAAARMPIIGVSGRTEPGDERAALAAGMNFYFAKPVSPAKLAEALAKLRLALVEHVVPVAGPPARVAVQADREQADAGDQRRDEQERCGPLLRMPIRPTIIAASIASSRSSAVPRRIFVRR